MAQVVAQERWLMAVGNEACIEGIVALLSQEIEIMEITVHA